MTDHRDTVRMPKQTRAKRKELFPHGHKNCFECEQFVREDQAEVTWNLAFKVGQREMAEAIFHIIEHPKKVNYRIKEITEYCEAKLKELKNENDSSFDH